MAAPLVHAPASLVGPARQREALTGALGRAVSLPTSVPTACGQRRPVAETSARPESVTCPPCRETAGRRHREWAEHLALVAGTGLGDPARLEWARTELERHADLARRYAAPLQPPAP